MHFFGKLLKGKRCIMLTLSCLIYLYNLIDGNIDENIVLNTFVFYLFSYDNGHVCVENESGENMDCFEGKGNIHPNNSLFLPLIVPTYNELFANIVNWN